MPPLRRNHFTLDEQARHRLCRRLSADYANRDADFGNARHVINLITTSIIPAVASRVSQLSDPDKEQLTTILPADIPADVPRANALIVELHTSSASDTLTIIPPHVRDITDSLHTIK